MGPLTVRTFVKLNCAIGAIGFLAIGWATNPLSAQKCKALLRYAGQAANFEARGERDWSLDGFRPGVYNENFASLLRPYTSFENWARARKAAGRSTHLLEIAGSAVFSDAPEVFDSLTGFRAGTLQAGLSLGPTADDPHHEEFFGNAYALRDWTRLKQNRAQREIPLYDLIVLNPVGGVLPLSVASVKQKSPAEARALFKQVLNRAWQSLSREDGEIFFEVPAVVFTSEEFGEWRLKIFAAGMDIQASYPSPYLRLRKTAQSPEQLPD